MQSASAKVRTAAVILLCGVISSGLQAQSHDSAHHEHMAEMNRRGAEAMGFDQQNATHHFQLSKNGGVIEVSANDPQDKPTLNQIRLHLENQAKQFGNGDFGASEHTHGRVPPGVETMQRLKSDIHYGFQATPAGGKITIESEAPEALAAIHDFLKFQIEDHETGDSTAVH